MGRRFASVVITIVVTAFAVSFHHSARAQPAGGGSGSDEIEMEPEQGSAGSGSAAGSGSDAGSAATPVPVPVKDPKIAKKWLSAAQQLVQKGDYYTSHKRDDDAKAQYVNAVTAYQKSIEAGDDISVYYELASVEIKLQSFTDAARHLKVVVGNATVKPAIVKQAQTKLDDVATKIGFLTLTITPDETVLTLDGKELGTSPLKEPLVLLPGTYQLALSANGFEPKEVELKIDAGSESERKIDLDPKKVEVQQVEKNDEPIVPPPPPEGPKMWPAYAGAGITAGLVVTSVVTGVVAISKHHTFTGTDTSSADRTSAQSSGKTAAHITDL
ncbi:MAG TPA: PEGA domain-containing protein, partial [Kofleriaceae bacterium]|nr:PEGA domain-containing protein [Kofleriaceae bacterium]